MSEPTISQGSEPTPAATVVPLRDGDDGLEVLMLLRSGAGAFGGHWVFPGGKVDSADTEAGGELEAARRAAVREAREEAGLALEEGALVPLSFWLPPAEAPRRFATWFFLAACSSSVDVVVDGSEVHEHRWMQPAEVIAERNAGRMELAPPTFTTAWWLSARADVSEAMADAAAQEPERFHTRVITRGGALLSTVWAGDSAYSDGDIDRPGPRRRLWMGDDNWRVEIHP